MIVSVCSFGSSGSSAVSDYLREFSELQVFDKVEFTWVSEVDGLIDLANNVVVPHSRTDGSIKSIERYRANVQRKLNYYKKNNIDCDLIEKSTDEFIESITQVKWKCVPEEDQSTGLVNRIRRWCMYQWTHKAIPAMERKAGHQIDIYPMKTVYLSSAPQNFYPAAKKHMREVLKALGVDLNKTIVLDQAFSGVNPQACFPFFDDAYAIVVDRDPRDMYTFSQTKLLGRNHFMACDNVQNFVRYYRAIRDNQEYRKDNPNVLRIQFEDMIYNYECTTKKIEEFLKLRENDARKTVFDPSLSIANTQVFKRFPRFSEDVKIIESELSEYLYDFSRFEDIEITGEMFFGKSPLNKQK